MAHRVKRSPLRGHHLSQVALEGQDYAWWKHNESSGVFFIYGNAQHISYYLQTYYHHRRLRITLENLLAI